MSEQRNKSERRRNWLCDLYFNYWTLSYLSFSPSSPYCNFFQFFLSICSLLLHFRNIFKTKKRTQGAYPILSTHTQERAACPHTRTHPRMHVHAYTHTYIHCCFTHVRAQPQHKHTLISTQYVHNHNTNTLMKDLRQAVNWLWCAVFQCW